MNENISIALIVIACIVFIMVFFSACIVKDILDDYYNSEMETCLDACDSLVEYQELECQLSCHNMFKCNLNEVENGTN